MEGCSLISDTSLPLHVPVPESYFVVALRGTLTVIGTAKCPKLHGSAARFSNFTYEKKKILLNTLVFTEAAVLRCYHVIEGNKHIKR
jgi:hypothetical protein